MGSVYYIYIRVELARREGSAFSAGLAGHVGPGAGFLRARENLFGRAVFDELTGI
jgi:hypothetical protein